MNSHRQDASRRKSSIVVDFGDGTPLRSSRLLRDQYRNRSDRSRRAISLPSVGILQLIGCITAPQKRPVDSFSALGTLRVASTVEKRPVVFWLRPAARASRSFSCSSTALPREAWNPIGSRMSWCTFTALAVVFSSSPACHDLRAACCCTRKAWSARPDASASMMHITQSEK